MKISSDIQLLFWLLILMSCNAEQRGKTNTLETATGNSAIKVYHKPPASINDTLTINFPAAVFYHPDSLQLLQIKAQTDPMVFDGSMHEFFYQMRNARMVISKNWPVLKQVEAKNCRYLLFIKKDLTPEIVDLNTKTDAYGLLVFNQKDSPLQVDMTNIETMISFYLK